MGHRLVNGTLVREGKGIDAICECGWASRGHFSSLAASAAFREHYYSTPKAERQKEPDVSIVTINGRNYPSMSHPGIDPDKDEVWRVLDHLKPGLIHDDVRAYLAGAMEAMIHKARAEGRGAH